jgi:hypothetical protein
MPVEFGIWRIDKDLVKIPWSSMDEESRLESILVKDLSILGLDLMILGRQVRTSFGGKIDILATSSDGHLHVIEMKRNLTPRDVVAQLLDYSSWVATLTRNQIIEIFKQSGAKQALEEAFSERFHVPLPEELNEQHHLVVVASEIDQSTERIVAHLSEDYGVPINTVFFRCFREGAREYLARTWLIDPAESESRTEQALASSKRKEAWNGRDFYVAFGVYEGRSWADACKYGFVSAGHGRTYSDPLKNLHVGARVWVHIPEHGYVGVGEVVGAARQIKDFTVKVKGKEIPILDAPLKASKMGKYRNDPELCEYLVHVKWRKTLSQDQAYWERGMFANQNTVCKLRNKFTLDKLAERFGITE